MLEKTFTPSAIEAKWYAHWEEQGLFRPARPDAEPFSIVLPPPNVTGTLHIGHALDQTLQDVLIRWQRLKGKDARWVVGTDHAGIATQMVVERTIASQGLSRKELGREAFLKHVWEWKEQSGGAITRQMRRLGASADWSNERFTMDDGFNKAVVEVFVRLHEAGLIYRDKRLVNWDPKFQTAISDLEVETREMQGHFWHLRYPLADGSGHLVVATTRPETMLGDTAVAVNPSDERYAHLIGRMIAHPLTGREIPIVGDDWADPELGSGCVKITPAHDFNDWQVYERHKEIGWINILDSQANILSDDSIPQAYRGLDRFEARKRIVADLDALGLLERVEDKTIQTPFGDRSGVVIEPWLTDQWYIDTSTLAAKAREAVTDGSTSFVPKAWEKTYFNWMDNIQPWCISRQLWWGHRIPAWFGPEIVDGEITRGSFPYTKCFVARSIDELRTKAAAYYGTDIEEWPTNNDDFAKEYLFGSPSFVALHRDEDVLDTWFSSGLWPFVTLGWPDNSEDLKRFYPGSVLVTGFDIIFFWVARMMMFGLEIMDEKPFETVYIHGLVRDAKGQKMSKSKGNTVDPLELIDRYGADALRFTMAASETQGRDVKFDEKRVEGYRNFATKLWNAVRFAQAQGITAGGAETPTATLPVNRWILAETAQAAADAEAALSAFRYDQYALGLYQFVWSRFCDWYLELIKPLLAEGGAAADETRAVAGWVIDQMLILLHPAMPFLTEELWHAQGARAQDLIVAEWPALTPTPDAASAEIGWLIDLVSAIRSARTELNVPPAAKLVLHATEADEALKARLQGQLPALERLARIESLSFEAPPTGGSAQIVVEGRTYALPLEGVIDLTAERARLLKGAEQAEKEASALNGRLSNPGFVERAKPEAIEKAREDHAARSAEAQRLRAALARLG
ncbi:valine--tRNA ligase [Sandaracinobacter neustonicus]|uniref:Valine--tRNA ligase n=1 Tax=Sandaracinobacter neustonicus TaxID=1715348 RepID=A0A501XKN4_9SPHN|nr:valine--tRNA ligase [Sandaracinobacter neustonicus]TPE61222.1 valine--tRNA ligase [Sandaracinobacter neustonicus]